MSSKQSDNLLDLLENTQDQLKKVQLDYELKKTAEEYDKRRKNKYKKGV